MQQINSNSPTPTDSQDENKRVLGLWPLTTLVTGNMIGSGIFLLPASLAALGSIGMLGWLITATGAIVLACLFARLSFMLPRTGGAYSYCRAAFGNFIGFQVAFSYWIQTWVGNAAIALAFVGYLATFWPPLVDNPLYTFIAASSAVWVLTGINILGVREAGWTQIITTVLKLAPLILIIILGIWYIEPGNFLPFNRSGQSNFIAISSAATLTLWSFIGLEAATVPAGAAKNPQRDIPRATIIGTLIAALVYILSTIVVFGLLPNQSLISSNAPFADAGFVVFGKWAAAIIAIGAAISCFGALNGWILVQAQVPYAAAEDKLFPRIFTRCNKHGSPIYGLIISSALVTFLLSLNINKSLVKQFTFAILLATLASLVPYLYTAMAYFLVNRKQNEKVTVKHKQLFVFIAIVGFCYAFWAISGAEKDTVLYGMMLMFASLPLYAWIQWRNKHAG